MKKLSDVGRIGENTISLIERSFQDTVVNREVLEDERLLNEIKIKKDSFYNLVNSMFFDGNYEINGHPLDIKPATHKQSSQSTEDILELDEINGKIRNYLEDSMDRVHEKSIRLTQAIVSVMYKYENPLKQTRLVRILEKRGYSELNPTRFSVTSGLEHLEKMNLVERMNNGEYNLLIDFEYNDAIEEQAVPLARKINVSLFSKDRDIRGILALVDRDIYKPDYEELIVAGKRDPSKSVWYDHRITFDRIVYNRDLSGNEIVVGADAGIYMNRAFGIKI